MLLLNEFFFFQNDDWDKGSQTLYFTKIQNLREFTTLFHYFDPGIMEKISITRRLIPEYELGLSILL